MSKDSPEMRKVLFQALTLALLAASAPAESFVKHPKWFPVGPNPCSIVAQDLNGDGVPEIVTADRGVLRDPAEEVPANPELSFLVATGPLRYESQPPLRAGFAPWCIAVANMDALRALDLVVGSFHAGTEGHLTLFLNIGENKFKKQQYSAPVQTLTYMRQRDLDERPVFTVPGITSLAVEDFDGDGYRDVIATGWSSDVLLFFPGTVDTYLGAPRIIQAPGGPRDVQGADFDKDGNVDLVTTMYSSGQVVVCRGDGKGGFEEVDRFSSRGRLPHKVRIGDLNQDGKADLVVSHCHSDDSMVVFYGQGGFSFPVSQEILLGTDRKRVEHEIRDILVEDLTQDGKPDIAAACYASSQVTLLLNESKGASSTPEFRLEHYSFRGRLKAQPRALCSADFNGNGKKDLAVALWNANAVAILLAK